MFSAFGRALAQLPDPEFRRPLAYSLGLTVLVFAGLWTGLGFALAHTRIFSIFWLDWVVDALGGLAAIVLTLVLFPGVAAAIVSLFLDRVVVAVEARYYPDLPPARAAPLAEQIGGALRFLVVVVGFNLLALPLYLVPALNLVVFYGLNGYLLAREYFELVAPRRLDPSAARVLWRSRRAEALAGGVVFALVATVPLVNMAAPVFAAATMTHLVEGWRRRREPKRDSAGT